jgi:uncharacterized protein
MSTVVFLFAGELNDFLARDLRGKEISLSFEEHQSAKHLIEALGVPHVEVGIVRANGVVIEMSYQPRDGDRLEVQPAAPGCPVDPRFVLDNHLGRLAAYLRMLGFDCLYRNDYADEELAEVAACEGRILLTRDRRLLMRKVVQYGYCLRSLDPQEQLVEVVRRFQLAGRTVPFRRCLRCNGPLEPVSKEAVFDRLEPKTKLYYNEFAICRACDQVYWKGSHYERMRELAARVTN